MEAVPLRPGPRPGATGEKSGGSVSESGTCRCGIVVEALPLAQATVSQHLRLLKEAGLVQGEIDGPRVCYCVNPGAVRRLKKLVEEL